MSQPGPSFTLRMRSVGCPLYAFHSLRPLPYPLFVHGLLGLSTLLVEVTEKWIGLKVKPQPKDGAQVAPRASLRRILKLFCNGISRGMGIVG